MDSLYKNQHCPTTQTTEPKAQARIKLATAELVWTLEDQIVFNCLNILWLSFIYEPRKI